MIQDIFQTFLRLGLKQTDAQVLFCCLHHKEGASAQQIADGAKVKRSTVDLILTRLIAEGYVTRLKVGGRFRYFPREPEKILYQKEQALEDFKNLIPVLGRLGALAPEVNMRYFEGADGIRHLYEELMLEARVNRPADDPILTINAGFNILKLLPDFEKFHVRKRIAGKIPVHIIAPVAAKSSPITGTDASALRTTRYFDEARYPFRISVEICGDLVGIYSPLKPVNGIMMRHRTIATSMKSLFNLIWDGLSDS